MAIKRGATYTPDKKSLLMQEVRDEIINVEKTLKRGNILGDTMVRLQKVRSDLVSIMQSLADKKGVVTPQETDKILESISLSKKARMGESNQYEIKMTPATIIFVGLIVYAAYNLTKGKI